MNRHNAVGIGGSDGRPSLLRDIVYKAIKARILNGEYSPGHSLKEAVIAREFKVSKTPVREALGALVQEELINVFPRVGYAVTGLTFDQAHALLDYRLILELAALELASHYSTPADFDQLALLCSDRGHEAAMYKQGRRFHLILCRASRNSFLEKAVRDVFTQYDRVFRLQMAEEERVLTYHRRIYQALRSKEPEKARQALIELFEMIKKSFVSEWGPLSSDQWIHSVSPKKSSRRKAT
jgi:DNA-binding GntR family transcriptional regulator